MPKITFPKAPKTQRIQLAPMTAAPSRFVLKAPRRISTTAGKMQNLIRVRSSNATR